MPLEVGKTINHIADTILKSPMISTVINNPFYTALLTVVVIMMIMLFVFRGAEGDESVVVMTCRAGFWIFFILLGVIFIHNKITTYQILEEKKDGDYGGVFHGSYDGILADAIVPVTINTDF